MLKLYYIIVCILCSLSGFAQTIAGKIIDEDTGAPVLSVSIYVNNTSNGTLSNNSGEFSLNLPNVYQPEIIVSSIGYEIISYKLNASDDLGKKFLFKLKRKQNVLQEILILPDATRQKYLKLFVENFLGITEEASKSKITNLGAINFGSSPTGQKGFIAFCDTPLVIVNNYLGYKIHFQLQQFEYYELTGATSFYGFTRFEDMGKKDRWIKNRKRTYYGSSMHFFRSFIADQLKENNFTIFHTRPDSLKGVNGDYKKMTVAYPAKIEDILKKDSAQNDVYIAKWKYNLMVQYNKNPPSKDYLRSKFFFLEGNLPTGFRSSISLVDEELGIDFRGILINPLGITFSGYWVYEKAANLLPFDYMP